MTIGPLQGMAHSNAAVFLGWNKKAGAIMVALLSPITPKTDWLWTTFVTVSFSLQIGGLWTFPAVFELVDASMSSCFSYETTFKQHCGFLLRSRNICKKNREVLALNLIIRSFFWKYNSDIHKEENLPFKLKDKQTTLQWKTFNGVLEGLVDIINCEIQQYALNAYA